MLVNYNTAKLRPADRAMLDFAVRATTKPSSLTKHDVAKLHRAGFDYQEVLSIVLVTCLVNLMNRSADCLGVDVPTGYQNAMRKWLTEPAANQPWLMKPVDQKNGDSGELGQFGPLGEFNEDQAFSQLQASPLLNQNGSDSKAGHDGYDKGDANGTGGVGVWRSRLNLQRKLLKWPQFWPGRRFTCRPVVESGFRGRRAGPRPVDSSERYLRS